MKIQPQELRVKVLDDADDLSCFDCSENDIIGLNEFIHDEALDYQKELLGVTYLFLFKGDIVGFATLLMGNIEIKNVRYRLPFLATFKEYPALIIGRLAVGNSYRRRGIGKNILFWCLGEAQQLSKRVGCKFVVVLTQGEDIISFYKKCDFEIALRYERKRKILMYQRIPS